MPAQRNDGVAILQEGHGWGYGMSVVVAPNATGAPAGTIGWSGGFGSKRHSDPAAGLTTMLMTQCMFDGPKPAPVFETFEGDAKIRLNRIALRSCSTGHGRTCLWDPSSNRPD